MKKILVTTAWLALAIGPAHSANILPAGQIVTGNTTAISLTAGSIIDNPNGNTTLSNDGDGNLVVQLNTATTGGLGDYYLTWVGAAAGLDVSSADYSYLQVDIIAVSPGLTTSGWQLFWQDDDSGIGGPNNSSLNIGDVDPSVGAPFSIVIDLTSVNETGNGGTTGAKGWGPGQVGRLRLDPFQNAVNAGESFTISAITLGESVGVPEEAPALELTIAANASDFDFSWPSKEGKVYDLVSSTDLSSDPGTWEVLEGQEVLSGTGFILTAEGIAANGDPRHFYAVIERDAPAP